MKNMQFLAHGKNCRFSLCATYRHIKGPCSEQDYIELFEEFLVPGIHVLKVKNITVGRNLVDVFSKTLKNFHEVGCLTVASDALPDYVTDIHQEILLNGDIQDAENLENYFLDMFSYDFLWIEATKELQKSSLFADLNTIVSEFHIDQQIPIVVLTYEK